MSDIGTYVWSFLTNEAVWSAVTWGVLAAFFKAWKEAKGDLPDWVKIIISVLAPLSATYAAYHIGVWAAWWQYDHLQEVASLEMAIKGIVGSKLIFAALRGTEEARGMKAPSGTDVPGKSADDLKAYDKAMSSGEPVVPFTDITLTGSEPLNKTTGSGMVLKGQVIPLGDIPAARAFPERDPAGGPSVEGDRGDEQAQPFHDGERGPSGGF